MRRRFSEVPIHINYNISNYDQKGEHTVSKTDYLICVIGSTQFCINENEISNVDTLFKPHDMFVVIICILHVIVYLLSVVFAITFPAMKLSLFVEN